MTARQTNGAVADGKTVWSWHPLLVSSRRRFAKLNRAMRAADSPATEARGIRLRGEHGISRKTIAQGRPDAPANTECSCAFFVAPIAHETAGASQHPAFPAPSDFWGLANSSTTRAQRAAGMRTMSIHVIASAAKQSICAAQKEEWIASLRSQ